MDQFTVLLSLYFKESPTFLTQSLDSIFNQTLAPDEVVLIEDGPLTPELDNVVAFYAARHPEMKVVPLSKNGGLGAALNEGLKHCTHELVARMDTDDVCKPHRFERQMEFMMAHPEVDVCSAWVEEFVNKLDNVVAVKKLPESHDEIYHFGKFRNPINHPAVMFRRRAVEYCGGYQSFYLFEDYYLWARMLTKGCKFHNIPESLLFFRSSPDMFKRRGGFKYALTEVSFQKTLYDLGYISSFMFVKNVMVRFFMRIIPNGLRGYIYKKLIRK